MTVQELIDELECCDGDAEVRFLAQPSWPFEYTIAGVVEASDRPDDLSGYRETPARRVLLVEGRHACYGDGRAGQERVVAVTGGQALRADRAERHASRVHELRRSAAPSSPRPRTPERRRAEGGHRRWQSRQQ
jgi:hypothetical protein